MANYPKCTKGDCFQNKCGVRCQLLKEHSGSMTCPFYKTYEQVEIERQETHKKLVDMGRYDLIEKYEYNPGRDW